MAAPAHTCCESLPSVTEAVVATTPMLERCMKEIAITTGGTSCRRSAETAKTAFASSQPFDGSVFTFSVLLLLGSSVVVLRYICRAQHAPARSRAANPNRLYQ